jgi:hypothetical protein
MTIYYVISNDDTELIHDELFQSSSIEEAIKELREIDAYNRDVLLTEDYDARVEARLFKVTIEEIP